MGFGPFAYIPFILVFLKFNDSSYDMRQQVHKLMGVVSYLFIVVNGLTDSGMTLMDIALFVFASYFFYRAVSDNFDRVSKGGIVTMVVFAVLSIAAHRWGSSGPSTVKAIAGHLTGKPDEQAETQAQLKKALETVQKIQAGQQPPPETP